MIYLSLILKILKMVMSMQFSLKSQKPASSFSILVVDDSLLLRQAYSHVLRSWGYEVDVAVDGCDGFESFKAGAYELVITDYEMPNCNGVEFLSRVRREIPSKAQIPFLLVTGFPILDLASNSHGFVSVLAKPISLRVLRTQLELCLLRN